MLNTNKEINPVRKPFCQSLLYAPLRYGIVATAVSSVIAASQADARDVGAALLEEIIVTAQKREQTLIEVPLAISALSQQQLENENVTQFRYIYRSSPRLSTSYNFAAQSIVLSSRGISGVNTSDPVVASYIDDVPFVVPGQPWAPNSNFFDLQRVEIINGPQGTLWGQGAMGGTVRVLTNDPDTREFGGAVELGLARVTDGDRDRKVNGLVNIPIIEDKLAARVTYSREELGGFIDFPNIGSGLKDGNDSDYDDIRAKLLFTATEQLSIKLTAWRSEAKGTLIDFTEFPTPPGSNTRQALSIVGETAGFNSENSAVSLKVDYDFGNLLLTNTLSRLEADNIVAGNFFGSVTAASYDLDSIANELRIVSDLEGPWQFVIGHYYYDASNDQTNRSEFVGNFQGADISTLDSTVSAFFGEVSVELFDGKVEVILGLRRFEDDRDFVQFSDAPPAEGDVSVQTSNTSDTFDSTNPRLNVAIHPGDNWMIYFNAAKGYRSGGFNPFVSRSAAAAVPADFASVQPDEVLSYDLGSKFSAFDNRLSGDIVVFQSEWKDAHQSATFDPVNFPFTGTLVNAGDLDIRGIEYSFTLQATDNLSFSFSGSHLDTEWDSLNFDLQNFTLFEVGGEALGVPERAFNASITYRRPITVAGNELEFVAYGDALYEGENGDAFGGTTLSKPAHRKYNARFSVARPDSWEAALYIDNVTDEDDVNAISFGFIGTSPRPRTIGVLLKKYF